MLARHRSAGPRGRSVLKNAGVYTTVDYPSDTQITAADIAYIGGHLYYVFGDEEEDLLAAGFTLIPDTGFTLFPEESLYPAEDLFPGFDHPEYP